MKKIKLLLSAILLGACAWANALPPVFSTSSTMSEFVDMDTYSFGIPTTGPHEATLAMDTTSAIAGFGVFQQAGPLINPVVFQSGAGSTTFLATAGDYLALVAGFNFSGADLPYTFTVTPVPEPQMLGMLALGIGLVSLAARRRQRQMQEGA